MLCLHLHMFGRGQKHGGSEGGRLENLAERAISALTRTTLERADFQNSFSKVEQAKKVKDELHSFLGSQLTADRYYCQKTLVKSKSLG